MRGRSEATIKNCIFIINKFLNCYEDTIKISKLTIDDLTKHFRKYFLDKIKRVPKKYDVQYHQS